MKTIGKNYTQNATKNQNFSKALKYVSSKLENLSKRYWLAGGTLLGNRNSIDMILLND